MALEILREIMLGGLVLSEESAKLASDMDLDTLGVNMNAPLQLSTVDQRISAAKAIIQTGIGFKTDHTSGDEPLRRQVVLMPPWADEIEQLEPTPTRGALPSGDTKEARGNGSRGKKKAKARPATRRRSGGNGK